MEIHFFFFLPFIRFLLSVDFVYIKIGLFCCYHCLIIIITDLVVDCLLAKGLQVWYTYVLSIIL